MAATTDQRRRELDRKVDRYRETATLTLEQLRWVISYLYQFRKRSARKGARAQPIDDLRPSAARSLSPGCGPARAQKVLAGVGDRVHSDVPLAVESGGLPTRR
jgi:hypothetical protein